jgi:hypothetical protein
LMRNWTNTWSVTEMDKQKLIAELGRSRTHEDARRVTLALHEANEKFQRARVRAKRDEERLIGEIEVFLDDIASITGLAVGTKEFWIVASLCLDERLARVAELKKFVNRSPLQDFLDGEPR